LKHEEYLTDVLNMKILLIHTLVKSKGKLVASTYNGAFCQLVLSNVFELDALQFREAEELTLFSSYNIISTSSKFPKLA